MTLEQFTGQDVFHLLRPEQVNALSEVAEEISLGSGETVYSRGDNAEFLFVVLEGQVSLRLPRSGGMSVLIDEATKGAIFGYCVCLELDTYSLTAVCAEDSRLLKIEADTLKKLMDQNLIIGYALQTIISQVYFRRYLETMKKFGAVAHSIPLA
jgi:CRP-like cAMP-binding protein